MKYTGTFKDSKDVDITVIISTPEEGADVHMGDSTSDDIQFLQNDPVVI